MLYRWVGVGVALLFAVGCGRIGFDQRTSGDLVFAADDGAFPFGGAQAESVTVTSDGARLDVAADFASRPTQLLSGFASTAATAIGGTIYLAGGSSAFPGDTGCSSDLLRYDPVSGDLDPVGGLPIKNQGLHLEYHPDGNIYSMMGYCGGPSADEAKVYRWPLDSFLPELVGSFPVGAYHFASGILEDAGGTPMLMAAGGYGSGPLTNAVQMLDVRDGSARQLPPLSSKRCLVAGAVSGEAFYVFGGNIDTSCALPFNPPSGTNSLALSEIVEVRLDPEQVAVVGQLPEPLAGACAITRDDGRILLFGGATYDVNIGRQVSPRVYLFDPATLETTLHRAELPEPRAGMSCTKTSDGRILLVGGADASMTPTDEILLFEPYVTSGQLTGPLVDSHLRGARWTEMALDSELPTNTSVGITVRISDNPNWSDDSAGWLYISGGLLDDTLPRGRYLQWRAVLGSDDPLASPTLRSLAFRFSWQ